MKLSLRPVSRPILGTLISLALVSTSTAALAAPDYGVKGPEATTTSNLAVGASGASGGKLVVPNGAGPYPIIIASHGFSASSANQLGWATHFASYGFVVAAPDFPGGLQPDHVKNGTIVEALVGEVARAVSKADATRVGLEGHSAGGLATTLAAAKLKPKAVVLFDPVDNNGLGKTAFGTLCSSTLVLFANSGTCNKNAEWKGFGATTSGPLVLANVKDATHCDGENEARGLCAAPLVGCGAAAAPARQTVHARYATALFMATLKGDTDAKAALAAGALSADTELETTQVKAGPECTGQPSLPDAGPPGKDGGSVTPPPTGTTPPAGTGTPGTPSPSPTGSADPSAESTGSGCSASPRAAGTTGALLAGLVAAALFVRRRRS
jgi:pimeloyl-ACP methyl ester carboxylesterase